MIDGLPRDYDKWRQRNAEDLIDIENERHRREMRDMERADEMRDRLKDEEESDDRKWSYYDDSDEE